MKTLEDWETDAPAVEIMGAALDGPKNRKDAKIRRDTPNRYRTLGDDAGTAPHIPLVVVRDPGLAREPNATDQNPRKPCTMQSGI